MTLAHARALYFIALRKSCSPSSPHLQILKLSIISHNTLIYISKCAFIVNKNIFVSEKKFIPLLEIFLIFVLFIIPKSCKNLLVSSVFSFPHWTEELLKWAALEKQSCICVDTQKRPDRTRNWLENLSVSMVYLYRIWRYGLECDHSSTEGENVEWGWGETRKLFRPHQLETPKHPSCYVFDPSRFTNSG